MNQLFADMANVCVLVYLDDILIFSKNEQEHKQHVHAAYKQLAEQDFHVKCAKCTLFTDSIEFLGHIVLARGIEVCPNKIGAIKDWSVPTNVRDVQLFLGLCNYFMRFISKLAHVARSFIDLTRKLVEFSWTSKCQQAFDALKAKLLTAPVLTAFIPEPRSEVWCDASNFAVGAVLMQQEMPDGPQQPVEHLSKRLSAAECNYLAIEREFVDLIQALRTQQHYLLGHPATMRTDHASL